jgi:SAM-dependent methyltransferase
VTVVEAGYLAYPVPDVSFDFSCANTSLHHMDFMAALTAMARALRPGGRLAVIGLAAHGSLGDYLADAPAIPVNLAGRGNEACLGAMVPRMDPGLGVQAEVVARAAGEEPGAAAEAWPGQ